MKWFLVHRAGAEFAQHLAGGKKNRPVYLKTDEHWNNFGGFVGYQQIMRVLEQFRADLKTLPLDAFNSSDQLPPGTTDWWQTNQYWRTPEVLTHQLLPDTDLSRSLGLKQTETAACFLKNGPPPFTTSMGPLTPYDIPWSTFNPRAEGGIMFFRDSFGTALIQFFGYHFNRATYVRRQPFVPALIQREKPQIVITEMAGRNFNTIDPQKLMSQASLN